MKRLNHAVKTVEAEIGEHRTDKNLGQNLLTRIGISGIIVHDCLPISTRLGGLVQKIIEARLGVQIIRLELRQRLLALLEVAKVEINGRFQDIEVREIPVVIIRTMERMKSPKCPKSEEHTSELQ